MTCTCPACGKKTAIEADVGDFPARCQRCGALLRRPQEDPSAGQSATSRALPVRTAPTTPKTVRVQHGVLAGLLISNSNPDADDRPVISRHGNTAAKNTQRLLRPESLREIARVTARQKALRKASLRGTFQALGALGTVAFLIAVALFVGALALEARALLQPSSTRADVLKSALHTCFP